MHSVLSNLSTQVMIQLRRKARSALADSFDLHLITTSCLKTKKTKKKTLIFCNIIKEQKKPKASNSSVLKTINMFSLYSSQSVELDHVL